MKKFGLYNDGINLHKMKIGKGIIKAEVEEVFGAEKSRNGFLLAEKLSKDLRRAAERLYCVSYQKSQTPGHVAKEFAIDVVLDKVQKKEVNWAEFASETNLAQRRSYTRRLKGWIQTLAELRNVPMKEVYDSEGFSEFAGTEGEKLHTVDSYATVDDGSPLEKKVHSAAGELPVHDPYIMQLRYYKLQNSHSLLRLKFIPFLYYLDANASCPSTRLQCQQCHALLYAS